jgi:uncharacterized repeat protein (TIGR03803 family)
MRRRFSLAAGLALIVAGVVLLTGSSAWASGTLTALFDFNNYVNEPTGNLIFDPEGNLYGTVARVGIENKICYYGCGYVYELSPNGTFQTIYTFTGGADGGESFGGLTIDSKGNLYGTTSVGGTVNEYCPTGCGTVFELSPSGGYWTFTLLHSFTWLDGLSPNTTLTPDSAGNLYGTTAEGGAGNGTVFEMSPSGGNWTFSSIYSLAFSGSEGVGPSSDLVIDGAGNLYETAGEGGSTGYGIVFELSPSGGSWKFTLLYTFRGLSHKDGAGPGGLVLDAAGSLLGVTGQGGYACLDYASGCGTVWELSQSGGKWKYGILHRFSGPDGLGPTGLIAGKAGSVYGTTYSGLNFPGSIFGFTPAPKGAGWRFTSLYHFTGQADGGTPENLTADASGNLYGTTSIGGQPVVNEGTVFEWSPK